MMVVIIRLCPKAQKDERFKQIEWRGEAIMNENKLKIYPDNGEIFMELSMHGLYDG